MEPCRRFVGMLARFSMFVFSSFDFVIFKLCYVEIGKVVF